MVIDKEEEKISSRKMRNTIGKLLAYELSLLAGFILDGLIGMPDGMIARIIAGFVGLTESRSIFENLAVVTGMDVWSAILKAFKPDNIPKSDGTKE